MFIPLLPLGDPPRPAGGRADNMAAAAPGCPQTAGRAARAGGEAQRRSGEKRETQHVHANENGPAPARPTAQLPALESGQDAQAESLRARAKRRQRCRHRQQPALRRRVSPQNTKPETGQGLHGAYFHTTAIVLLMRKGN